MSVELATAYIDLVPSMKGAQASIASDVAGVGSTAGDTVSKGFIGTMGGVAGKVVGIAAAGVTAVGGLIGGLAIKGGLSRQLQIEDATAKLSGLGNSAADVTTIMGNALASVKGTAFGMGEAATTAAGAVAAGIKPGQDLERILKLTGDAATIAGTSMGEMGGIFNKVASTGHVTGDVVAQLQDRGFPILQMLSQKLGKSTADVTDMVSKGKISFADFASAIETNVGGAALKSGETTRGALANMGAALSRLGVTATSGFFPLIKLVFNQVTTILDGVNAKLTPFTNAWGAAFQGKATPIIAGFATAVLTKFDLLFGGIRALGAAFQAGGDDITSSGFAGGMERVGLSLRAATDFIKDTWGLFVTGWAMPPSLAGMFRPEDLQGATAFGIGLRAVVDRIVPMAKEVAGGTRALGAAFQAGGDDITSSGFAGVMEKIGLVARQVWDGAQPIFHAIGVGWNSLMLALRTGDFSGVGGSVVSIFGALHSIADPLGNVLIAVGSNIGAVSTQLGNLIAGALPLVAPLIQAAADALKFLGDHSGLILPIVIALGAAWMVYKAGQTAANIAELAALPIKAASVVSQLALAAANNTLAAAIATANGEEVASRAARLPAVAQVILHTGALIAHGIAVGAVAVASGIATAAQWLWNAAMDANPIMLVVIVIAALVAAIIWAYNNIGWFKDGINAAWSFISTVTMTVLGAIGSFFVALWNGIVTVAVAVVGGFVGFVVGAWSNIVGFTTSAFLGVAGFLAGIWGNIVGGASNMIGGLIGFFTSLPGRILGALSGAAGWLVDVGRNIINGLLDGLRNAGAAIGSFFLGLLPGWIVGPFKAALGIASPSKVFRGFGQNIGEGVVLGAQDTKSSIEATMKGLVAVPAVRAVSAARIAGAGAATSPSGTAPDGGVTIMGNVYGNPEDIVQEINVQKRRASQVTGLRAIAAGV